MDATVTELCCNFPVLGKNTKKEERGGEMEKCSF